MNLSARSGARARTGAGRTALAALLLAVPAAVGWLWLAVPIDGVLRVLLPVLGSLASLAGAGLLLTDARRRTWAVAVRVADLVLGGLGVILTLAFGGSALSMISTLSDEGWDAVGYAAAAFSAAAALVALAAVTLLFTIVRRWWPGDLTR